MKIVIVKLLAVAALWGVPLMCAGAETMKNAGAMPKGIADLVAAETAFAKLCADSGIAAGFLHYTNENAVVFRPTPINAHEAYGGEQVPGRLVWRPTYAEISGGGDIGYTTGPWQYYRDDTAHAPAVTGHYVTIWQRPEGGEFRALLDIGVSYKSPQDASAPLTFAVGEGSTASVKVADAAKAHAELVASDSLLLGAVITGTAPEAYARVAADDIRLYRPGSAPYRGKVTIADPVTSDSHSYKGVLVEAHCSAAADFGYTYGTLEDLGTDGNPTGRQAGYARIWRRAAGGEWKLILDVVLRLPKPVAE